MKNIKVVFDFILTKMLFLEKYTSKDEIKLGDGF
jgi:hypothetical protein